MYDIYIYASIHHKYMIYIYVYTHCIKIATSTSTTTTSQNWSNQHQPPRRGPLATPRRWRPSAWYLQGHPGSKGRPSNWKSWFVGIIMILFVSSDQFWNPNRCGCMINLVRYNHIISISPGKNLFGMFEVFNMSNVEHKHSTFNIKYSIYPWHRQRLAIIIIIIIIIITITIIIIIIINHHLSSWWCFRQQQHHQQNHHPHQHWHHNHHKHNLQSLSSQSLMSHYHTLGIQSYPQLMIGVSNHLLSIVFRFHYHSQKVIGSLGIWKVHPGRLTWNLWIHPWKRKIIFQIIIFRFYVNLPGCKRLDASINSSIQQHQFVFPRLKKSRTWKAHRTGETLWHVFPAKETTWQWAKKTENVVSEKSCPRKKKDTFFFEPVKYPGPYSGVYLGRKWFQWVFLALTSTPSSK